MASWRFALYLFALSSSFMIDCAESFAIRHKAIPLHGTNAQELNHSEKNIPQQNVLPEARINHGQAVQREGKVKYGDQQKGIEPHKRLHSNNKVLPGMKTASSNQPALASSRLDKPGRRSMNNAVGFTARYEGEWTILESGVSIVFPQEVYNSGAYDAGSGIFTCPATGLYYFQMTLVFAEIDTDFDDSVAELLVDGTKVASIWFYDNGSNSNAQITSSAGAVVECSEGNEVKVRAGPIGATIGGNEGASQFMGYLIALI